MAARTALLIVDVVNAFDFVGATALLRQSIRMAPSLERLRDRAEAARCPVIYCNDNFGEWRSDLNALAARCTADDRPGREFVRRVAPKSDEYFILKPKHSAFYETALESLLEYLKVRRVVVCGIAGDGCVHSTATDAHIREFEALVAADATASQTPQRNRNALQHLVDAGYARLCSARGVRLKR